MRFASGLAATVAFLASTLIFSATALAGECDFCVCKGKDTVNSCTKCCTNAQGVVSSATKLELRISDDGKSLLDQNGNEVARFVEGTRVRMASKNPKEIGVKMQGCWRCYPVCVVWEGKKCVQWMRTCDWDFDCK